MKRRLPQWPDQLKKPTVLEDLLPGMLSDSAQPHEEAVRERLSHEINRRMNILAQFFGFPFLPDTSEEWILLLRLKSGSFC